MTALVVIGIPLFIWIQFFEVPSKVKIGEEKMQQDVTTHQFEKVEKYTSAYMGDASNMSALLRGLPYNQFTNGIELNADQYTLSVNYDVRTLENLNDSRQTVIYNATALMALIGNLEQVNFHFKDATYEVTRDRVEQWFGTTLVDFKDAEVFRSKVQKELAADVKPWFLAYTERE